jgi:hypothetical protein
MLESYFALCPRGVGSTSYRFYEAMQLGVVPVLIADEDTRPFRKQIDWETCSVFCKNINELPKKLDSFSKVDAIEMGKNAKSIYDNKLRYQKWCELAINELVNP